MFNTSHFCKYLPVVDCTGSKVRVEDSDNSRRCVSKNGIINNIQEVNQL